MKVAANHAGASDKGLLLRLFTEPTLMAGVACFGIALAFYTLVAWLVALFGPIFSFKL